MLRYLREFFTVIALIVFWVVSASVTDLPIKKIGSARYYVYTVQDGEDMFAVIHKLNVSRSDIIVNNSSAADGLRPGMKLYFPFDDFASETASAANAKKYIAKKGDTFLSIAKEFNISPETLLAYNPGITRGITAGQTIYLSAPEIVEKNMTSIAPEEPDRAPVVTLPVVAPIEYAEENVGENNSQHLNVVVCLPFETSTETPSKTGVYATDFYKGFLLGIDSLRSTYGNPQITISAVDCTNFNLRNQKATPTFREADIIIAPESQTVLNSLAEIALDNESYVFNVFQTRDSLYLNNPYLLQSNIPTGDMFRKAADWFVRNLRGATPVFLVNETGRKDKKAFIDVLVATLNSKGIEYSTLTYDGTLTSTALMTNLPPAGANYFFVAESGNLTDFQKISAALANYKEAVVNNPDRKGNIRLFGYPEFTRFTGDSYDKMKEIGTSFYTRFYNNVTAPDTRHTYASYTDRYGQNVPDGVPNQVLYGFDVAHWILNLASKSSTNRLTIAETELLDGNQTDFSFRPIDGGGFVNDKMMIVTLSDSSQPQIDVR